jgi:hypothetical protein
MYVYRNVDGRLACDPHVRFLMCVTTTTAATIECMHRVDVRVSDEYCGVLLGVHVAWIGGIRSQALLLDLRFD